MGYEIFSDITNQAIKIVLLLSAPMLIGALVIGILVSLFQAVTQINEQTLSFIPKIVVIFGAMVLFAPWMSETLINFTTELILSIPSIIAQQ
jgi:flagellar biosynthesis protein FliQ